MKRTHWPLWIIGALAATVAGLRLVQVPMTHDESSTVLNYSFLPVVDILTNQPPSANNHILNTLLVKGMIALGGMEKVLIRLPNFLALALYLGFGYSLVRPLAHRRSGHWLGLGLLLFNPYLLEFFALARGYGLGIGFMVAAAAMGFWFLEHRRLGYLAGSAAFALLAVYSNLTQLNFFVAWIGGLNLYMWAHWKAFGLRHWLRANALLLLAAALLAGLLYLPVQALLDSGELYYGGKTGFFADTIRSLIDNTLYGQVYFGRDFPLILSWVTVAAVVGGMAISVARTVRGAGAGPAFYLTGILALMVLSTVVQFHVLGTRFLIGRTALLFLPVAALLVLNLMRYAPPWGQGVLFSLLLLHLYQAVNFDQARDWWYDRKTEQVFWYLQEQHADPRDTIGLGADWIFGPTLNFYNRRYGKGNIIMSWHKSDPMDDGWDYYYTDQKPAEALEGYQLEHKFSSYRLYKRNRNLKEDNQ